MINVKRIGCPGCQTMEAPLGRNLRMRGIGWRPLRGYRSLHGLGQDAADGGGDFSSFDGGFDSGGGISPDTIVTTTPTEIPVIEPAATPEPLPYVDPTSGLPPGSTLDTTTGTIFGPGGSFTIFNDGSFLDGAGNFYDANGNLVQAATADAPAQVSPPAGASAGGGASGGGKGSGGGGSQGSLQQLLCALNPRASGCPGGGATAAAGTRRTAIGASSTSSFSSWWNQYWPWIVGGGVAVFVGPMLLDALTDSGGGGRRR